MTRILTGIQNSGMPHLGNVLGSILPAIALSENQKNQCFYFIADLHSLTSMTSTDKLREATLSIAAAWLACGLDTERHPLYRQSQVTETCEMMWYLSCLTPFPMLANAHSFKEKSQNLSNVNAGLFTYPTLMAADILLYDIDLVPVGKDQKQHLEICRDLAQSFNRTLGETLVAPKASIDTRVMTVPGTDGRKMSKSYGNIINIFAKEKELKKQVMSIVTDSKPLGSPKDPDTCHVFHLYSLLAEPSQIETIKANYLKGGYGYGHAKKALLELILTKFEKERAHFDSLIKQPKRIEEILKEGEVKAQKVARGVLSRVRKQLQFDALS